MPVFQIDPIWIQTEQLNFRDLGRLRTGAKTHKYEVRTRSTGTRLGYIQWFHLENRYNFILDQTFAGHVINGKFVSDLQEFCEWGTINFRLSQPRKQPGFKKLRARRILALLNKPDGGGLDKRYAPVVQ